MHSKLIQRVIWIFLGINIVLVCLYFLLFFIIVGKNRETAEIYTSLYKRASEKEKITVTEKSLFNTAEKRKILDSYFIRPTDAVLFIEQVEKLGKQIPVNLKLNSVSPPKKTGDEFLLDFSATGTFENIYRLFGVIDELPYRVSVKKAELSEMKSSEDKVDVVSLWSGSFTLVLESYLDK